MKKKYLALIVFIICLLIGIGIYLAMSIKPSINQDGQLSERSKQFLENRKKNNSDEGWRDVNFEKKRMTDSELENNYVTIDDCYRLKVPFGVSKEQERRECTYALSLQPSGSLVVSYEKSTVEAIDSVSGVMMRRQNKKMYKESSNTDTDISFVVFRSIASGYESSAFALVNGKLLTLSLSIPSNEDFDSKFEAIIKGLELL